MSFAKEILLLKLIDLKLGQIRGCVNLTQFFLLASIVSYLPGIAKFFGDHGQTYRFFLQNKKSYELKMKTKEGRRPFFVTMTSPTKYFN